MAAVGLVAVSHSRALAEAAVELALQMVHGAPPPIAIAAGMPDGGLGTDATEVMRAIGEVDGGAGVVVLVDLGSAVMSAELAVELLDDPADVRVVPAPFVEGLLAAVVLAAGGAGLDEVADEAAGALRPKLLALGDATSAAPENASTPPEPSSADASATVELRNEAGLHARPAAMVAAEAARFDADTRITHPRAGTVSARTPIGLATLAARQGDRLVVEATGPQASEAVAAVARLITDGFGELTAAPGAVSRGRPTARRPRGVSAGRVVGMVTRMTEPLTEPPAVAAIDPADVAAETERLDQALAAVIEDYTHRAEGADGEAARILSATAQLAADPTLVESATGIVASRAVSAASAFWQAANHVAETMVGAGGRLAERVTDMTDIRDRVVCQLLGIPMPGIPDPSEPFILVARDLAPSDTATLDAETCLGIVTAEGGPTSHTSILARAMGIPAVVGYTDALGIPDGATLLVDGTTGEVVVDPDEQQRASARTSSMPLEPLTDRGHTADGASVSLLANVASAELASEAAGAGAEGIGLFRTEICFLDRAQEPTHDEQVATYRAVLDAFGGRRVVIRTLDAGSDKPIPFLTGEPEPNPTLGVRGYRTAMARPEVLQRQLAAIVAAAQGSPAEAWVMAPMISTADEAAEFARMAREAGVATVGVMVETPSAALQAADILAVVDFVSVGTNDLTQYTMAADRQAVGLGDLQDPWQPGVLRLLQAVGDAGRATGRPVGVCGEAAADPDLARVLVGLGATSLSMSPRALRGVADSLAAVTGEQCLAAALAAVAATSAERARGAAAAVIGGRAGIG